MRVWKGGRQIALTELAVGDLLLVKRTGRTPTSDSVCTDICVGPIASPAAGKKS